MAIHLVKLCVGAATVADVKEWQSGYVARRKRAGLDPRPEHVTRHAPKRAAELVAAGSLYWVLRGVIEVRQRIVGFEEVVDGEHGRRCAIKLHPRLVLTEPSPRRAFQGWRYLNPEDAPADLAKRRGGGAELPDTLRRELIAIGAW